MNKNKISWLFSTMYRIRRFEETMLEQTFKGNAMGVTHSSDGQEAGPTGVCAHLTDKDWIGSTHRGHGHCIAKGLDTKKMMAEIFGKSTGQCKGKGGSMHIADFSKGMLGANAIVGASIPLAVGAALSSKYNGTEKDSVGVAFFGDGATGQGVLHESMNLASIWKLPVIFVCEDNGLAVHSPVGVRQSFNRMALVNAHGIPALRIEEGWDFGKIYEVMSGLVNDVREGSGPQYLEVKTIRAREHVGPGEDFDFGYRNRDDFERWCTHDPLVCDSRTLAMVEANIMKRIDIAVAFAEDSAWPGRAQLLTDVI